MSFIGPAGSAKAPSQPFSAEWLSGTWVSVEYDALRGTSIRRYVTPRRLTFGPKCSLQIGTQQERLPVALQAVFCGELVAEYKWRGLNLDIERSTNGTYRDSKVIFVTYGRNFRRVFARLPEEQQTIKSKAVTLR